MIINAEPEYPDLNIEEVDANLSDFSAITDLFLALPTFHFDSAANFADRDYWNAAIVAGNIIPIHDIYEVADQSEAIGLVESKHNFLVKSKPGNYRFKLSLCVNLATYQKLVKYESQNLKCFTSDINGNNYGVISGATIVPFDIDPIIVDKIKWGASDSPSWTNIYLSFSNPDQMKIAYINKPLWEPSELTNVSCTLALAGGWSFISNVDFTSWTDGIPTGFFVSLGTGAFLESTGNKLLVWTDYAYYPADPVLLWSVNPPIIQPGNYRFTIDINNIEVNAAVALVVGTDNYLIERTVGTKTQLFTVDEECIPYLFVRTSDGDLKSTTFDNWKLEVYGGSLTLTVTRADGDQITGLLATDITISDDTNGTVVVSSLTETSPGVYTLVPAETLTTGTITLLTDQYNGTYDYDL